MRPGLSPCLPVCPAWGRLAPSGSAAVSFVPRLLCVLLFFFDHLLGFFFWAAFASCLWLSSLVGFAPVFAAPAVLSIILLFTAGRLILLLSLTPLFFALSGFLAFALLARAVLVLFSCYIW